jgi:hypothetical protein
MNRRKCLAAVVGAVFPFSGCTSNSNGSPSSDASTTGDISPPSVDLTAEDVSPSDTNGTLRVAYRSGGAQSKIGTNPATIAEDGQKWLIVELSITNEGDEVHEVSPSRYVVQIDNQQYTQVITDRETSLKDIGKLEPGGTVSGEIVYHIPEEASDATLTVRDDVDVPRPVTATFVHAEDSLVE